MRNLKNAIRGLKELSWISDQDRKKFNSIKSSVTDKLKSMIENFEDELKQKHLNIDSGIWENFDAVDEIRKKYKEVLAIFGYLDHKLEDDDKIDFSIHYRQLLDSF